MGDPGAPAATESSATELRRGRRRFGAAILLLLAMAILLTAAVSLAVSNPQRPRPQFENLAGQHPGYLTPIMKVPPATSQKVTVGMYALDAYDIDPEASTFYMTGYLWLRWKGDLNPVDSLEFVNAVDDWGLTKEVVNAEPTVLASGEKVQDLRFQGRFYEPFDMSLYPLDTQRLNVLIESDKYPISQMVFEPDSPGSGLDTEFTVPGWLVSNEVGTLGLVHTFGTSFGYPQQDGADTYSAAMFTIELDRARSIVIWKIMLPLFLVLITAWLALVVSPEYPEIRMGMPATALLTTVFLKETAAIPSATSPVTLDRIYVVAFASIVLTLAMVIWDEYVVRADEASGAALMRVERRDMIAFVINVVVTFGIIGTLIVSAIRAG